MIKPPKEAKLNIFNSPCLSLISPTKKINNLLKTPSKQNNQKLSPNIDTLKTFDIYNLNSKLNKDLKRITTYEELERRYPIKIKKESSNSDKFTTLNTLKVKSHANQDFQQKNSAPLAVPTKEERIKRNHSSINFSIVSFRKDYFTGSESKKQHSMIKEEIYRRNDTSIDSNKDLNNKVKGLIDFSETKHLSFGADLIIKNISSKGEIYLGSNNYKHNIENLDHFDVVVNVIGEFPEIEFKNKNIMIKEKTELFNDTHQRIIETPSQKQVLFIVKETDSFKNYKELCDIINDLFFKGNKLTEE